MLNTLKAYLKSEGSMNYRDCELRYYTYSMVDEPSKYRVNVNVSLHHTQNNYIKTLALDEFFDQEAAAINYGIDQGKRFIDRNYEQGKISIVEPEPAIKAKNDKSTVNRGKKTDKKS